MDKTAKTPSPRLFIGGLPYKFTEGELLDLFAPFGRVVSLKIMHTPWGRSRGIGFIEFDSLEAAVEAKNRLHNHSVAPDRTIIVDFAQPDPVKTDEGRRRHEEAVQNNPTKFKNFADAPTSRGSKPQKSSDDRKFKSKPKFGSTRQSVYDQRSHHSKVGAKFAKRNKSRKP